MVERKDIGSTLSNLNKAANSKKALAFAIVSLWVSNGAAHNVQKALENDNKTDAIVWTIQGAAEASVGAGILLAQGVRAVVGRKNKTR